MERTGTRDARSGGKWAILIVDDDEAVAHVWERALRGANHRVAVAHSLAEARAVLERDDFDAVVLDLQLGDGFGAELFETIEAKKSPPATLVVSGHADSNTVLGLHGKADLTLPKPVLPDVLLRAIEATLSWASEDRALERFGVAHRLSGRETELLRLAANGIGNEEAARTLDCAPTTIKTYWRRIFDKTGRRSQRDVIAAILEVASDDG